MATADSAAAEVHPAAQHNPIGAEALDDPTTDPRLVRRILSDLERSNRWLGGVSSVRRGLALMLDPSDRGTTLTLLDIGAGAGDVAQAAVRWTARRDVTLKPFALERHRTAASMSRDRLITTTCGCATTTPFASGSFDIVLLAQLLHHFADDTVVSILTEANRIARRGVVITDLRPSRAAAFGYRLVGPLLRLHPVTVTDGVTSLARGRSAAQLATLAGQAGARQPVATNLPLARVLVAWRSTQ